MLEDQPDGWSLTSTGQLLRGDAPGSVRDLTRLFAAPEHQHSWNALEYSVLHDGCAFEQVHGAGVWNYAQNHPALNQTFNAAMSSLAGSVHRAIVAAYDFSEIGLLVDIGGGHGRLMAQILEQFPGMGGIVYDLPHVVNGDRRRFLRRSAARGGRLHHDSHPS